VSGSAVSEDPALAGREFFPFGSFEHRMVSGAGCTYAEGLADVGRAAGTGKSPALKPEPRKWSNLPRNISTRMGVCRVGAVGRTFVSPRNWTLMGVAGIKHAAEVWKYDDSLVERRGIE